PRLHETEVASGNFRFLRQVELAQAPVLPPLAQVVAEGPRSGAIAADVSSVHAPHRSAARRGFHYLGGNQPLAHGTCWGGPFSFLYAVNFVAIPTSLSFPSLRKRNTP